MQTTQMGIISVCTRFSCLMEGGVAGAGHVDRRSEDCHRRYGFPRDVALMSVGVGGRFHLT